MSTQCSDRLVHPARFAKRTFTAQDLWAAPRVGAPTPSPDGSRLAVAVKSFDLEANEGLSAIWLLPAEGGAAKRLTAPGLDSSQPAWSADGSKLALVRKPNKDAKAQIWVLRVDGGEAECVTNMPLGVTDPKWLPDGSGIVFVAEVFETHPDVEATRVEAERRSKDPVKVHATEDRVYRFWDRWLTTGERQHLFVVDLATRRVRDLTPDATGWIGLMEHEGHYDIAPDGSEVAWGETFADGAEEVLRMAVYTAPIAGGPRRSLTADRYLRAFLPRYARDGRSLVYGYSIDPHFYADRVRLVRYDRAQATHADLLVDWPLSPTGWETTKTGGVAFEAEIDGRSAIFSLVDGGEPSCLTAVGSCTAPRPAGNSAIYCNRSSFHEAPEIFRLSDGEPPIRLSHFTEPALRDVSLGEVREIIHSGAEGELIQTWLVLPPDYVPTRKYPLVHVIHGGPHGISADAFHWRWNAHLFAAPGYIVACVNFQGSTSRGQDFAERIQGAWGERPAGDILAATDHLIEQGLVDPDRVAITGGSYGGYLVSWLATQTQRFRCIVNHAGVFDLLGQYATDATHGRAKAFGGEPWSNIEGIDRFDPARWTKDMATPMLILHGERDYRVPIGHALMCYNILKAKGVPARLVYFPDENHWILKPQNSLRWYDEVHRWLARWLASSG